MLSIVIKRCNKVYTWSLFASSQVFDFQQQCALFLDSNEIFLKQTMGNFGGVMTNPAGKHFLQSIG